jgi:hypothetical protein
MSAASSSTTSATTASTVTAASRYPKKLFLKVSPAKEQADLSELMKKIGRLRSVYTPQKDGLPLYSL